MEVGAVPCVEAMEVMSTRCESDGIDDSPVMEAATRLR